MNKFDWLIEFNGKSNDLVLFHANHINCVHIYTF